MNVLLRVGREGLLGLADALVGGRLRPPFPSMDVARCVGTALADDVAVELRTRANGGMALADVAWTLRLLADEVQRGQRVADRLELVWTGPSASTGVRDTAVVVRSLLAGAERSVLLASYVVDKGAKAHEGWKALAEHLDDDPAFEARLFLNVPRAFGDERPDAVLLREFSDKLADAWPGRRRPAVWFDPRTLRTDGPHRPVLHAKVVVVDDRCSLVTSANFTEAAHERNIEAGVLVDDPRFARALRDQWTALVTSGDLVALPGWTEER